MKLKIGSSVSASAQDALTRHAEALYATPRSRRLAVVELARLKVTTPDEDTDAEAGVELRVRRLEIASPEQEDALRQALDTLEVHRTGAGRLDAEGIDLDRETLHQVAEHLDRAEAARLRVGTQRWAEQARRALHTPGLSLDEARHELDSLATGLEALILLAAEKP